MATKKGKQAYDFAVASLKKNKKVEFATVRDAAKKKGLTLYPIVYGRAKAALGLVPVAKYGTGKAAKKSKSKAKKAARGPGRPRKSAGRTAKAQGIDGLENLVSMIRDTQKERDKAVATLAKIRDIIDAAI